MRDIRAWLAAGRGESVRHRLDHGRGANLSHGAIGVSNAAQRETSLASGRANLNHGIEGRRYDMQILGQRLVSCNVD